MDQEVRHVNALERLGQTLTRDRVAGHDRNALDSRP
jgi:hypothetical protein